MTGRKYFRKYKWIEEDGTEVEILPVNFKNRIGFTVSEYDILCDLLRMRSEDLEDHVDCCGEEKKVIENLLEKLYQLTCIAEGVDPFGD